MKLVELAPLIGPLPLQPTPSLLYPDPQKIVTRVWAIGFGGNVHSGMLLTHNYLPRNASLVDFSSLTSLYLDVRGKADTLKHNSALSSF